MGRQRFFAFVSTAVLTASILALNASPAQACEPGYCIDQVLPSDGATGVPTDAKLWVFYDTTPGSSPTVTIERVDTEEVVSATVETESGGQELSEVSNMVAVVTPDTALQPDTSYRISFSGGALCGAQDSPVEFTTGSQTAENPDDFTGGIQISSVCVEAPEERNSCNDGTFYPHVSFGVSPVESTSATAFGVYRDGDLISMSRQTPVEVQMRPEDVDESSCFRLRKFNIAGTAVTHDLDACPNLPSTPACTPDDVGDAGDAGDTDSGTDDVGSDAADTADVSDVEQRTDEIVACGCSSSTPRPPFGAAVLALFFLGVRLRRRV